MYRYTCTILFLHSFILKRFEIFLFLINDECSIIETYYSYYKSLVQRNNVEIPKSRKMGLLHLFDIKDEIFKENFLKFQNLL